MMTPLATSSLSLSVWLQGMALSLGLIVGGAIAYVIRKFLLPAKPRSKAATFIPIQQIKSKPKR